MSSSSSLGYSSSSSMELCCVNPDCIGTNCTYFYNWTLNGLSNHNSNDCELYAVFDYNTPNQTIFLYKGDLIEDLVAIGYGNSSPILIEQRNSSGLSGSVEWDLTPVYYPNELLLTCEESSSSSSSHSSLGYSTSSSSSFEFSTSSSSSSSSSFLYSTSSSSSSKNYSTSSSSSSEEYSSSSSSSINYSTSSSSSLCCDSPYCHGLDCVKFSSWTLNGFNQYNGNNCQLYVQFDAINAIQQVRLYRDNTYSTLVALGQSIDGSAGTINFTQRNGSGLSGSVEWNGDLVTSEATLDCFESSSSSSSLEYSSSSSSYEYSTSSSSSSFGYTSTSSSSSSLCCESPYCHGTDCIEFSSWLLNGFNQKNGDDCKLYVRFHINSPMQQVWLYKHPSYINLVAAGQSTDGSAGTINFTQRNGSGLSGSVEWSGNLVASNVILDCFESSSSSSSSLDYSTSSSSSSSRLSSNSSSSSSSSSSFLYSTSSSSSLHEKSASRLIPFTFETEDIHPALDIAYYGGYSFVGTGNNGEILRSTNRYHWGTYYKTNDISVSALYVLGQYLYAGTSPNGKIYSFNMANDRVSYYGDFGSSIVGFLEYKNDLFVATTNGQIYIFNKINNKWEIEYTAYGEITEIELINNTINLAIKGENVITYDGSNWSYLNLGEFNISSVKKVNGDFSFYDFSEINRSSMKQNVDTMEVYPINRSIGLSCIEQDGTTTIMGSYNNGRIYSLLPNQDSEKNEFKLLFDVGLDKVYDLINIDVGVNLASIGNKLYLINSGFLPFDREESSEENEEVDAEEIEAKENKAVILNYPSGGEQFELGEDIIIQWSSSRNQNDAVKLSLYKGNEEVLTITSKTSNDGRFEWSVPLFLETGNDYKVYIEWLSAGEASEDNKDISGNFAVVLEVITTTTTTTSFGDPSTPDTSVCRGIPILVLPEDEYILKMSKDNSLNSIVLLTSQGRILECKESVINGYLTGNRTIWGTVKDGSGIHNTSSTQFMYALYNRVIEVSQEKEIVKWQYLEKAIASPINYVNGVFISPVLYVQEDIGEWRELIWDEIKEENTDVLISLKAADSVDELFYKKWDNSFASEDGEGGHVVRSLNGIDIKGKYAQIKVEMISKSNISPSVANVSLVYSAKQASYFFTTKFSLENGSNINKGMVIAQITEPVNTEIQIGICDTESTNWNDYTVVPLERFFDINKYESIRVGMKFTMYDETHAPSASNFSIIFSGDKSQRLENE